MLKYSKVPNILLSGYIHTISAQKGRGWSKTWNYIVEEQWSLKERKKERKNPSYNSEEPDSSPGLGSFIPSLLISIC